MRKKSPRPLHLNSPGRLRPILLAILAIPFSAYAQIFAAPSCGNSLADSTCYTAPTKSSCSLPVATIGERGACPLGYVGMMDRRGVRDSCTDIAPLAPGLDESSSTNCGSPLSAFEALNIQRGIFEVSKSANQAYLKNHVLALLASMGSLSMTPLPDGHLGDRSATTSRFPKTGSAPDISPPPIASNIYPNFLQRTSTNGLCQTAFSITHQLNPQG